MRKNHKYHILDSNGRITTPAEIRKKLKIKQGTKLYIEERDREIVIRAITPEYIESLAEHGDSLPVISIIS